MSASHPERRQGQPWTVRVALWSARHRWPVFGLWFVVTIGLFVASLASGGIRTVAATGGVGGSSTEARQGSQAMSSGSAASAAETLTVVITSASARVTDPAFRDTVGQVVTELTSATATVDGSPGPALSRVVDPYQAPASAGLIAPDQAGVIVSAQLLGSAADRETRSQAVATVISAAQAASPGFAIHAVSNTLTNDQIGTVVTDDLDGSLRISLPATFIILVIAFGAVVAAFVPLLLAITALLAAFGLLGLYSQVFNPVSPYATQLVVLIGLAVAVDYSLFMITRFRSERRAGRDEDGRDRDGQRHRRAGRLLLRPGRDDLAGRPVPAARRDLPLDGPGHDRGHPRGDRRQPDVHAGNPGHPGRPDRLAVGALPGPRSGRRRRPLGGPGRCGDEPAVGQSPWSARRSCWPSPSPVLHLHLGESDLTSFPESVDGVQAIEALQAHWPQGTLLTLEVVVTDAQDPADQGRHGGARAEAAWRSAA